MDSLTSFITANLLYRGAFCPADNSCCGSPYKVRNESDAKTVFAKVTNKDGAAWKVSFTNWLKQSDTVTRALRNAIRTHIIEAKDAEAKANAVKFQNASDQFAAFGSVQEVAPFCGPVYCSAYCNRCKTRSPQVRFAEFLVLMESVPAP